MTARLAFHAAYHAALSQKISALMTPFAISIHSFTPHPLTGDLRDVEIGLLVKHDPRSAERFLTAAQSANTPYDMRVNEPYSAYELNYTVDRHLGADIPHLNIEVRQDLIATDQTARDMADHLAPIIAAVVDG